MNSDKKNTKTPKKPKYNMLQNTCYFITLACKEKEKKVPIICLLLAGFTVVSNLINLYISPVILGIVEQRESISKLLITILFFAVVMMFCSVLLAYINTNALYGRLTVRVAVAQKINKKAATTSYSNIDNQEFIRLCAKSRSVVNNNSTASEAIWDTLTQLLQNTKTKCAISKIGQRITARQKISESLESVRGWRSFMKKL